MRGTAAAAISATHHIRFQVDSIPSSERTEKLAAFRFHPNFQLTDSPRYDWTVCLGPKTHWLLNGDKIPTGKTTPIEQMFPDPNRILLKEHNLDDVFSDLVRDLDGNALMSVRGKSQQFELLFGPQCNAVLFFLRSGALRLVPVAQVRTSSALSRWPAFTDAMNLAFRGIYRELQMLPPGQI